MQRLFGRVAAAALALMISPVVLPWVDGPSTARAQASQPASGDTLILKNGQVIKGQFVEETDTQVKFMVVVGGIAAPQWFNKSEILKVERGAAPAQTEPALGADPKKTDPVRTTPSAGAPSADAAKVYVIELKGKFGEDITQTPMRDAIKDARKQAADYLVFVVDNEWQINELEKLPDDAAAFDELFRAEEITPIFVNEIPREWEKPPQIVFWVKQAMGGAAFLPFISKTIYMSSDARWGGIGNLSTLFGSMGDERVRQKQYSLRMGHAEGWAIVGGYEPRIVKAMARYEYILSYKLEGGRPVYIEEMPDQPDEFLLTDDGKDTRVDTIQALARGEGNDVLTLNADIAKKLLISKGTVDSMDDLLFALVISRNYQRVDKKATQIMEGWSRSLEDAKKDLRRLWDEFREIQVQGDYSERSKARGQQIAKINEMIRIMTRYEEALTYRFFGRYGIPPKDQLETIKEQIRQQQLSDKR
jgi:hypothetical protein